VPAEARLQRQRYLPGPGADPTKHDFSDFTHVCKIFLQICVKFLTNF
jgi:hypothetical protein